jgi:hypothetical protein
MGAEIVDVGSILRHGRAKKERRGGLVLSFRAFRGPLPAVTPPQTEREICNIYFPTATIITRIFC